MDRRFLLPDCSGSPSVSKPFWLIPYPCCLVTAFCGLVAFSASCAQVARGLLGSVDHHLLLPALGLATDLLTHLPWSRYMCPEY